MIKNLVFDMGGVLVDIQRERAIKSFIHIGLVDAEQIIDSYHHKGFFYDFENGDIDADEFCRQLCVQAGKDIPRQAIENAWKSMIDPPETYKLNYLKELRKTYQVFLLTNNNPIIIGWANSPDFTSEGALTDFFDKIYVSYQMKCMKPDLKIYRMLLEDADINPAETLFIDDSDLNIQAADACSMKVLLVKNSSDWRDELSDMLNNPLKK